MPATPDGTGAGRCPDDADRDAPSSSPYPGRVRGCRGEGFPALLGILGALTSLVLRRHTERGDDQLYSDVASYADRRFKIVVMIAPDGKLSRLAVTPR
jgi:hypothetical protein